MKHLFTLGASWMLLSGIWAQTILLDNFNRADANALGNGWTEDESSPPGSIELKTQRAQCNTGGSSGREWFYQDVSGYYPVNYQNAGTVTYTWSFNMRQSRTNPSGFNNSNYGVMFVLGASDASYTTGSGYGVALGNSGATDPIRLVRFTGGFNANSDLTNLIAYGDYGNEYLAVRVDFDVAARKWRLYVFDSTDFRDPATLGAAHLVDSVIDSTYTNLALPYLGGFYNHASSSSQNAFFDNVSIPYFPPSGKTMLAGGTLTAPDSIASIQNTPSVKVFEFVVVDDSLDPAVDSDPTRVTAVTVTPGNHDQFARWDSVIGGAYLVSGTDTLTGTVAARAVSFSMPAANAGDAGYVADNGRKAYTLHIWISPALPENMRDTADGNRFHFRLEAANITVGSGSTFDPSTAVTSDSLRNVLSVTATRTRFRIQPTTVWRGQTMPAFTVGITDANGNVDEDGASRNVTVTPTFSCPAVNGTTTRTTTNGIATFDDIVFYGTLGGGTLAAVSAGLAADTSASFSVKDTASAYHTLAYWDFSDATRGFQPDAYTPPNVDAVLDVVGAAWDGAGGSIFGRICNSARTSGWDNGAGTKYFVTRVSTVGYPEVRLTSHQRSSPGGPRDFVVQYSFDSVAWTTVNPVDTVQNNCTSGMFSAVLPAVCADTDTLYIRWLMNTNARSDGSGNVIPAGACNIYDVLIEGLYYSAAKDKYYRSRQSGDFHTGCTWEWSSDSITWTVAEIPPDFTSKTVHVRDTVTISVDSLRIDQIVIDSTGYLEVRAMMDVNDGPYGADINVKGVLKIANANSAPIGWDDSASWRLYPGGTFIKTGNGNATDWRDHYEGGMASMPSDAHWIIRKESTLDPTFTTIQSYYPNLTFDNATGTHWHPTGLSSYFTGSSGTAVIKGTLRLQNGVTITHANSAASPIVVMGDMRIGANDTLLIEGTGFEVQGDTIEAAGVIETRTGTPHRRLLHIKPAGSARFLLTGGAYLHEWIIEAGDTVTLTGDVHVDSLLTFTSGILKTTGGATVFVDSAAAVNELPLSYLYGRLQVQEDISTPNVWYDFAGMGIEIQYSGTAPGLTTVLRRTDTFAAANGHRGIRRIAYITPTVNTGLNASLRFYYNDAAGAGELDTLMENRLDLFRYNGLQWDSQGAVLNTALNVLTKTGIPAFSPWTAGDNAYPLPVELMAFSARWLGEAAVRLDWMTASERGVRRFVVERSVSRRDFEAVAAVPAAGNAIHPQTYAWIDRTPPHSEVLYYRLRIEDDDGSVDFSPVRVVRRNGRGRPLVYIGSHGRLVLPTETAAYEVYNAYGQRIAGGKGAERVDATDWPAGLYYLRMVAVDGQVHSYQLVKP